MGYDKSEILLISITLCCIAGVSLFVAMVLGSEYGVLEVPYGPYILLILAVIIAILAGLIVLVGVEPGEKEKAW